MALKLTITSEQRDRLSSRASIVLGVGGGSIGRSHDNDWVLPDPNRYLSAHHARVTFRHGAYYLTDMSTNGVYVNDGTVPLGKHNSYPLRGGDRLRLGDYYISVVIDPDPSEAPEASSIFPVAAEPAGEDLVSTRGDIGAQLNVRDLLRPDPSPSSRIGPVDAFGQPVTTEDTGLLAFDQSGQRSMRSAASATAARRELRAIEQRASTENAVGIEALCRGAGVDPKSLPPEAAGRLLHLAGVLLREALVGLKGLSLAQREMREQTEVDVGREDPQQVGLTGLPVEDLFSRLLVGHDKRELDAVQWLRDTLGGARRHDLATMRALRAALTEFIARLNPSELSALGAKRVNGGDQQVNELNVRFRSITEMPHGKLPHLFVESFARAFAAEYRQHNGLRGKN